MTDYLFTEQDIYLINAVWVALDQSEGNKERVKAVVADAIASWRKQRTVAISLIADD